MKTVARMLVLYDHPRDFPLHVVTRWQEAAVEHGEPVTRAAAIGCLFDSLEDAVTTTEALFGETLFWWPRYEDDDEVIVGVWLDCIEATGFQRGRDVRAQQPDR